MYWAVDLVDPHDLSSNPADPNNPNNGGGDNGGNINGGSFSVDRDLMK